MRKIALSLAIIGLTLPFLAATPARAQGYTQTWVSGSGSFSSTCGQLSDPCAMFDLAVAHTTPGGAIGCAGPIDDGFSVTITKTISISCEPGMAFLRPTDTGLAIIIAAAATDVVTLRGLAIEGEVFGNYGVLIQQAKEVHIENSTIRNFRSTNSNGSAGIATQNISSTTVFLYVVDTVINSNGVGILLLNAGGYKIASLKNVVITGSRADGLLLANSNTYANITDSIISGNGGSAVNADASSTTVNIVRTTMANNAAALNAAASGSAIRVSNSDIYNNSFGILIANGATVQSDGTNKHGNSNGGVQVPNASFALY
jgi:hypothetical protein